MSHPSHARSDRTTALCRHLMDDMAKAGWAPREVFVDQEWIATPTAQSVIESQPRPNNTTIVRMENRAKNGEGILWLDWSHEEGRFIRDTTMSFNFGAAAKASMHAALERSKAEDLSNVG